MSKRLVFLLILLFELCNVAVAEQKSDTLKMELTISAFRGSENAPESNAVLAGSQICLWTVFRHDPNLPDKKTYRHASTLDKAAWSVAFDWDGINDTDFVAKLPEFQRKEFVPASKQARVSAFWEASDSSSEWLWRYEQGALVTIPPDLAGKQLRLLTHVPDSPFGVLISNWDSIRVIAPKTAWDSLHILRSHVYFTYLAQSHDTAKALADSLYELARIDSCRNPERQLKHPHECRYDKYIRHAIGTYLKEDKIFETIEPSPNPLRDYRELIIEEERRRCDRSGQKGFENRLKPAPPGNLSCDFKYFARANPDPRSSEYHWTYSGSTMYLYVAWQPQAIGEFYEFRAKPTHFDFEDDPCKRINSEIRSIPNIWIIGVDSSGTNETWTPTGYTIELIEDSSAESRLKCMCENPEIADQDKWWSDRLHVREHGYLITLPSQPDDSYIKFQVSYEHETFGAFSFERVFRVSPPVSFEDSQRIVQNEIQCLRDANRPAETIAAAKRAASMGMLHGHALSTASYTARRFDPVAALDFLDRTWEEDGLVTKYYRMCNFGEPWPEYNIVEQRKQRYGMISYFLRQMEDSHALPRLRVWLNAPREMIGARVVYSVPVGCKATVSVLCEFDESVGNAGLETSSELMGLIYQLSSAESLDGSFAADERLHALLDASIGPLYYDGAWQSGWVINDKKSCWPPPLEHVTQIDFEASHEFVDKLVRIDVRYKSAKGWEIADSVLIQITEPDFKEELEEVCQLQMRELAADSLYGDVLAYMDSLTRRNENYPAVLAEGWKAAIYAKNYTKALDILDYALEKNGYFTGNEFKPIPFSEEAEAQYRMYRYSVLRKKLPAEGITGHPALTISDGNYLGDPKEILGEKYIP